VNEDRSQLRRAYVVAKTNLRAFRERYYPVPALGGRAAEAVTPEVLQELSRLEAVAEAARAAWEAPRPS
jgi:hypothetical protein